MTATMLDMLVSPSDDRKMVIVHYHLFKNAGSSLDHILKENFGDRHAVHEFTRTSRGSDAVAAFLAAHPDLLALSSHTAVLPAPRLDSVTAFPILFVRHPIDRLHSSYTFERTQREDTAGARLAREQDFAGYLRALLARKRGQGRDFQAARLAFNEPPSQGSQRERALRAIAVLPFIGLVECFDQSLEHLAHRLRAIFPDFRGVPTRKNISRRSGVTLEQRLAAIEKEIGQSLYRTVCDANSEDLEIFHHLSARYGFRAG